MMNNITTYKLTPQQLADLIDEAFNLGKVYATDELNSTAIEIIVEDKGIPVWKSEAEWNEFIESNGGHTLHSGEAKLDLLFELLKPVLRDQFGQIVCFD
jgi:hypothetical protein